MLRTVSLLALILSLVACTSGTTALAPTTTPTRSNQPVPGPEGGPGPADTGATPSVPPQPEAADLEHLVGLVPLDSAGDVVWLSNRGHAKEVYGLEGVDLLAHLESAPAEEHLELVTSPVMAGIPSYRRWDYLVRMQEDVSFSHLTFNREVWSDGRHQPVDQPAWGQNFFIGEGDLDEDLITEALVSQGYYATEHRGIEHLRNSLGDRQVDMSLPPGREFGQMNRVFLVEDRLTISNSTQGLTPLLDVEAGGTPTLLDSPAHLGLVRQIGGNTIGLAFLPPRLVQELQQGLRQEARSNDDYGPFFYERYQDWRPLHPFNLAAVGYRTDGQGTQLVVALYYPDPEAAGADAAEFERRWEEYFLNLGLWRRPAAELCSSFQTRAMRLEASSVLMAVCEMAEPGPSADPRRDIRPAIWHNMVQREDLLFLIPDPAEYPAPDCGGKFNPVPSRPDIPASVLFKVFCEGSPDCIRKFEENLDKDIPGEALYKAVCGLELAPTAAPTVTPTPEAVSPFRDPTPTPLPLSGIKKVEYDLRSYRVSDISGERFVSIGPDGEIYLVDIESGEKEQITDDGHRKREAVISGDYVAWIDQRRQIEIYDSAQRPPEGVADDIFLYNLATKEMLHITEAPARRSSLSISGHRLVWTDRRNEAREHYAHADIYSYNISTGDEQPVVVAPGSQISPSIHGDLVVWQDNRNSPTMGMPGSGCGDCPDNRYDIYLYDFSTDTEKPLVESEFYKRAPSIYENYVVWQDFRNGKASDIYLLDLATGEESRLTDGSGPYINPMVSGNHVIWHRRFACDVGGGPGRYDDTGVFAYNLNDGEVRQLSNYIEPRAIILEDVVLIEEGCLFAQRIYSVSLRRD